MTTVIEGKMMQKLKKILAERGMSQHELAAKSGVTQASISLILNGKRSPKWATVVALADALGISLDDLRDDIEEDDEEEQCAAQEQMCLCA